MTKQEQQNLTPAELRDSKPGNWIAVDEGDYITGRLMDVTEAWSDQRNGGQGGFYPLLTVAVAESNWTPYQGAEIMVHCFRTVLYNEIERQRPEISERLTITYRGTSGKAKEGRNPAELFTVRVLDRQGQAARAYGRMFGPDKALAQAAQSEPELPVDTSDLPFATR